MRRLFWLALGVTVGVLAMRKLSQTAQRLSPDSVGRSLAAGVEGLSERLRDFAADVRVAMREQEVALRSGAGFDGDLGAGPARPTSAESGQ